MTEKKTEKETVAVKSAAAQQAPPKKRRRIVPLGLKFSFGLGLLLILIMVLVSFTIKNSVEEEIVEQVLARGELTAKVISGNCVEYMAQTVWNMDKMLELLEIDMFVQEAVKKMESSVAGITAGKGGVWAAVSRQLNVLSEPIVEQIWGERKFEQDVLYASVVYKNDQIISHSSGFEKKGEFYVLPEGAVKNTTSLPMIQTRIYDGVLVYDLDYPMMYFEKKVGDVHLGLSSEAIDKAVRKTIVNIALITLAVFVVGFVLTFIIANVMVQPISLVVHGVNAIAAGNLNQKINFKSNDELGLLTDAFNDMAASLRDKEKMRNAFTKYVSSDVVDQAMAGDTVKLGGSKKEISIFFSDIVGFTPISESLSPEALVKMLNEYFNQMVGIIVKHGGTLDKFMGDAIMAIFGAPNPQPDHALRAVMASLEMRKKGEEITADWKKKGRKHILDMGMAINTGDAVVGNIGSDQRLEYTAIGDTVNTCSRMEGITRVYQVKTIIGEKTAALVKDKMIVRELDFVRVKGKKEPARIYELVGDLSTDKTKLGLVDAFQRGLINYRKQKWDEALEEFAAVLKVDPTDGPAQIFKERCLSLKATPPAAGWDGVFQMTTK